MQKNPLAIVEKFVTSTNFSGSIVRVKNFSMINRGEKSDDDDATYAFLRYIAEIFSQHRNSFIKKEKLFP